MTKSGTGLNVPSADEIHFDSRRCSRRIKALGSGQEQQHGVEGTAARQRAALSLQVCASAAAAGPGSVHLFTSLAAKLAACVAAVAHSGSRVPSFDEGAAAPPGVEPRALSRLAVAICGERPRISN
ncbi:hypothetical protein HPB50_012620 [Hyalomma asiaticum]|uniref:Uncharacterized protein n=1 Tax=Hyalomma asiaticum TaxID=266040 RepID=A0ACB7S6R4_HYAAI|nr:hypothetical protein HPB50_012620 [Hyalomma asiaticum]